MLWLLIALILTLLLYTINNIRIFKRDRAIHLAELSYIKAETYKLNCETDLIKTRKLAVLLELKKMK